MPSSGTNRRLATIMFADIDGYSRLMRADEEQTLDDLRAHLTELVGPVVERFHGRIVKTVGDGVLVEFASAVEAVRSAVELQRGMFERNINTPAERRQAFRIGLHLGDIIVSDEDVFGDTVNLAARLQGLAEAGSVVLSASVYEQVRDKLALPFRSLGARTLKNIDRPMRTYSLDAAALSETGPAAVRPARPRRRMMALAALAVATALVAGGAVAYLTGRLASTEDAAATSVRQSTESGLSVAVLVFANQSGDAAQDYFSDGLTEDITRALGRFKELTVIAYGAVLPFRNKELPPSEIGRALNARYLVSGSVRRMGPRVRVTVQLSDAVNGTQLWSEQYDDELSDIFAVQERIARRVAGTLASSLQQIALQASLRKPTDNLDAYDLVLRARALAADPTRLANRSARELLERVTQLAPGYADAYAQLADTYFQRAAFGWSEFAQTDVETAIRLAQKAIDLDEECVLAHGVLARAYTSILKYDIGLAESERALQINPSDSEALLTRAAVLLWTGRIDESIATAEAAMRLNVNIGSEAALNLGLAYLLGHRYADAVRLLEAARARYPSHPLLDFPLAAAYAELGRTDDALDAVRQGRLKNPHF
ncbi:MAG TPA: tetratricopeptide repeat protein, partial [Reyranella sp.]|nr:tetratricopeptide repeat protein [Reyranella sp.]